MSTGSTSLIRPIELVRTCYGKAPGSGLANTPHPHSLFHQLFKAFQRAAMPPAVSCHLLLSVFSVDLYLLLRPFTTSFVMS